MIRLVIAALVLATPAAAQDASKVMTEAKTAWLDCVELAHALGSQPTLDDVDRRSERSFAACRAEEDLFLAMLDMLPSENLRRQGRLMHFKAKLDMKKRLTNADFEALARAVGKQ